LQQLWLIHILGYKGQDVTVDHLDPLAVS